MKKLIALSAAATLMSGVAVFAQDAAGQQLAPTIGTGAELTLVDPTTGVVSTQTPPPVVPPVVALGSVGGVVAGVVIIENVFGDDDDDGTSATGS